MFVQSKFQKFLYVSCLSLLALAGSCGGKGGSLLVENPEDPNGIERGVFGPNVSGTPDTFRGAGVISSKEFLFGGPLARGTVGDLLLQNDKIRLIIRKNDRFAGIGTFGGNPIDIDLFRPSNEAGQDNFGYTYPLVNIAWTINYQRLEIINSDFSKGPVVIRATGFLDVYDYIMTNVISLFAKVTNNIPLFYSDHFDASLEPFKHVKELKAFSPVMVTDYTLEEGKSYITMQTRYENTSDEPIHVPLGQWINGSGSFELFIPKKGFQRDSQLTSPAALVYGALQDDVPVSYGYFYQPDEFLNQNDEIQPPAGITVSGVTILVDGELDLTKVFPTGGTEPALQSVLQPGTNTFTRYLAVGNGDIASVLNAGYEAMGVKTFHIEGKVTDSNNASVEHAKVLVFEKASDQPMTAAFTDAQGNFSAQVSRGKSAKDKLFGDGDYKFVVYKEGYHKANTEDAGSCGTGIFHPNTNVIDGIDCHLGSSASVEVSVECEGEGACPAQVTIVGFDPSPIHPYKGPASFGRVTDVLYNERPYGIVDLFYLDPFGKLFPQGKERMMTLKSFRIEPGEYQIFFSRGDEYTVDSQKVLLAPGANIQVHGELKRVLQTPGFVSGDFHAHGIDSPDSPFPRESRLRSVLAAGLDTVAFTDHESVSDYGPLTQQLGYQNFVKTMVGDEITPFAYGHMITWPLTPDPSKRGNGPYDYTFVPSDENISPDSDLSQSMGEIAAGVEATNPGEQVISIAHITDKVLGNFSLSKLVTTEYFGQVEPLSSYGDPVANRLPPNTNEKGSFLAPYPLGTSQMFTMDFTSMGLTISTFKDTLQHLVETSLPTYFNLLNLGKITSATCDSDGHYEIVEIIGECRNYVASSVDPRDGEGSYAQIDPYELAANVNQGKVIVSNGIFIDAKLKSADDVQEVGVGGTVKGTQDVTLELEVSSNSYYDWDEIKIFANTEPLPAKDDMSGLTNLEAKEFYTATSDHLPRYLMDPVAEFSKFAQNPDELFVQTVADGKRSVKITQDFHLFEDTWFVVLVTASDKVVSTFPVGTKIANTEVPPEQFLTKLNNNARVELKGSPAWAFTNPMFVDIQGDGFESKYIADGSSPLAQ